MSYGERCKVYKTFSLIGIHKKIEEGYNYLHLYVEPVRFARVNFSAYNAISNTRLNMFKKISMWHEDGRYVSLERILWHAKTTNKVMYDTVSIGSQKRIQLSEPVFIKEPVETTKWLYVPVGCVKCRESFVGESATLRCKKFKQVKGLAMPVSYVTDEECDHRWEWE